jgi:predicted mannosyl-3-phosphoglycerate phosphatase (HAD superfamily)
MLNNKKRVITIRGEEYPVRSLEGDLNIQPLLAFVRAKDMDDSEQKKKAAKALREFCPKIPTSVISEDGWMTFQAEEWQQILWDVREIYVLDNIALSVRLGNYREEFKRAKQYAEFKAIKEKYYADVAALDEDQDLTDLPDDEPTQEMIDKHHFQYYERAIAESEENSERREKLIARLNRLKDKSHYKGQVLAVNSENEILKQQIEALQRQVAEKSAVNE